MDKESYIFPMERYFMMENGKKENVMEKESYIIPMERYTLVKREELQAKIEGKKIYLTWGVLKKIIIKKY